MTLIDGADVVAETHRMEMEYGLTATDILEFVEIFSADLTPSQLALVRCDAAVTGVSDNGPLLFAD